MRTDLRAFVIKLASVIDAVGGGINTYSSRKDLLLKIKKKDRSHVSIPKTGALQEGSRTLPDLCG